MSEAMRFPFQNPKLPLQERVQDLVSRLTLEEKIQSMMQYQPEVDRLGVKAYKHGTEAAHGIAWLGEATTFPQPTGLACTWDTELMKEIGTVIGEEARAYFKKDPAKNGLTLWFPTVDLERDPRWGRNEEAYGEDPQLTGELSAALVQGVQGDHPKYYRAIATLKHFLGNNNEKERGQCSVSIDPRNMREYYLKAFQPAFQEGGAKSMMTAYNSINGTPALLHPAVNEIVKDEWGMDGFVVSDAADVIGIVKDHGYYDHYADALADTIKSGIDSLTDDAEICCAAIRDALDQGKLSEDDLDKALRNTFSVRFRLGEFDPEEMNPYAAISESVLCRPEHEQVSLKAAQESIVLLKNENGMLPLNKQKLKQTAVIGPLADTVYMDWYSGTPPYTVSPLAGIRDKLSAEAVLFASGSDEVSLQSVLNGRYVNALTEDAPLAADSQETGPSTVFIKNDWGWGSHTLRSTVNGRFVTTGDNGKLTASAKEAKGWFVKELYNFIPQDDDLVTMKAWHKKGVAAQGENGQLTAADDSQGDAERFRLNTVTSGIEEAVKAAQASDTAIVVVGNSPFINGKEEIDRPDIMLPPEQERLIQEVYQANPNTVVVVIGSYPFALNWAQEHVPAIVYMSHSGQELGRALADVLFGDYSPAGRLNMTWYPSVHQLPDMMDYDIIKGRRTYQYFSGDVLYPFGHGLTYTSFRYRDLELSTDHLAADGDLTVRFTLENTGDTASDEVPQLYVRLEDSRVKRPLKQLRAFHRMHLKAGEARQVTFVLPASELAFWDVTRERYCVESGGCMIMVGASSDDIRLRRRIEIKGETVPPRRLDEHIRAENYDDYEGVILDESKEGGTCVQVKSTSGWISFHDVLLEDGVTQFEGRIACPEAEGGSIEIRLDSPNGTLAGRCRVPSTGGRQAWDTVKFELTRMSGRRHVYLKLSGDVRLSSFRIKTD